jgi:hypothetical protein
MLELQVALGLGERNHVVEALELRGGLARLRLLVVAAINGKRDFGLCVSWLP